MRKESRQEQRYRVGGRTRLPQQVLAKFIPATEPSTAGGSCYPGDVFFISYPEALIMKRAW